MQIPFVMMLALTGLGCDNKTSVVVDASPLTCYGVDSPHAASYQVSGYSTSTYPATFAPTPYPEILAPTTTLQSRVHQTGTPEYVRPSTALCSVETQT